MGSKNAGTVQETDAQRAQAAHAMSQLQDYRQRWLPVQQHLASTILEQGAEGSAARTMAAGKASSDTAMSFDKANSALEKSLTNSGAAPGSSRANLAISGIGADEASAGGLGHLMSEQQMTDAYTQNLGALMSLGRGERATVGTSLTNMARSSAAQAQADAQASLMEREGNAQLVGQVAGFGVQQGASKQGSDKIQAMFSQTGIGGSGFGTGLAYGNQDLASASGMVP